MRPLSLTASVRARQVAVVAAVVAVATGCGSGLSAGHASAAGHGHLAAPRRPAAVSHGIAEARHRGAVPQRRALPCLPTAGSRRLAATACRALPHAPVPYAVPWRITCPMPAADPGHLARPIVSRPGCRLFCLVKARVMARCGPIWGCWNAALQPGTDLLCAEGSRPPQDTPPGRAAAAGRPATSS